ncbi:GSCOCG00012249001-RA-CDS [Cotesia congregata]|nr:GSCOCG00012249001-RA-CDS [Cotesia congregata]
MYLSRKKITLVKDIYNKLFARNNQVNRTSKFSSGAVSKNEDQNVESEINDEPTTHFGFKTVKERDKSKQVYSVFEKVADSYDVMNDAMSFGVHRIWKDLFIQELSPSHGCKLLDTAGGTGDITFRRWTVKS